MAVIKQNWSVAEKYVHLAQCESVLNIVLTSRPPTSSSVIFLADQKKVLF